MDDEIRLTREEWRLLKQVMRTLTWGKLDATRPWYALVDSVESRFPEVVERDQLIAKIMQSVSSEMAVDNYKKYLPKRTMSKLKAILREIKASDVQSERKDDS